MPDCPISDCDYTAKTAGAITQHVNKVHTDDRLAAVRNTMGGAAPQPGGAFRKERPMTVAPSGVPSVDFALGLGGVPRGTIIEVFGPAASGKTTMALTFSAYAQQQGQKAGYMDAERAFQATLAELVPGLNLDTLEYGMPPEQLIDPEKPEKGFELPWDGTGEAALEASRRMVASGEIAIWTVDSVAACVPRAEQNLSIGDPQASAAQARMFRAALRVLTPVVERSNAVLVFVNHVTAVPQVKFGRDWSRPVEKAFDYWSSIQLQVNPTVQFYNKDGRKVGHRVLVKVYKSKIAAPHAKAEFDLFFREDVVVKEGPKACAARQVYPGIDIVSCWFSVLKESNAIVWAGNRYVHVESGLALGSQAEVLGALEDPTSDLYLQARALVYPEKFQLAS